MEKAAIPGERTRAVADDRCSFLSPHSIATASCSQLSPGPDMGQERRVTDGRSNQTKPAQVNDHLHKATVNSCYDDESLKKRRLVRLERQFQRRALTSRSKAVPVNAESSISGLQDASGASRRPGVGCTLSSAQGRERPV